MVIDDDQEILTIGELVNQKKRQTPTKRYRPSEGRWYGYRIWRRNSLRR